MQLRETHFRQHIMSDKNKFETICPTRPPAVTRWLADWESEASLHAHEENPGAMGLTLQQAAGRIQALAIENQVWEFILSS